MAMGNLYTLAQQLLQSQLSQAKGAPPGPLGMDNNALLSAAAGLLSSSGAGQSTGQGLGAGIMGYLNGRQQTASASDQAITNALSTAKIMEVLSPKEQVPFGEGIQKEVATQIYNDLRSKGVSDREARIQAGIKASVYTSPTVDAAGNIVDPNNILAAYGVGGSPMAPTVGGALVNNIPTSGTGNTLLDAAAQGGGPAVVDAMAPAPVQFTPARAEMDKDIAQMIRAEEEVSALLNKVSANPDEFGIVGGIKGKVRTGAESLQESGLPLLSQIGQGSISAHILSIFSDGTVTRCIVPSR